MLGAVVAKEQWWQGVAADVIATAVICGGGGKGWQRMGWHSRKWSCCGRRTPSKMSLRQEALLATAGALVAAAGDGVARQGTQEVAGADDGGGITMIKLRKGIHKEQDAN